MSKPGQIARCRQGDVKRTGRQWHSGPPPHLGWWNASAAQDVRAWRWWDGRRWSRVTQAGASAVYAAACAEQPDFPERQACILWTDYWPEGARVPRHAVVQPTGPAVHDWPACALFRGGPRCTCVYQDPPDGAKASAGWGDDEPRVAAARPPCTVCGTAYEKHGSFPTCATHPYTADGNCQHVIGAACLGAECKAGCVRARGVNGRA